MPGSGQSDRLFRQWRPVLIDATQSDSGSNHFDYLYGVHNGSFQGGNAALESFCRIRLPDTGRLFCVYEIKGYSRDVAHKGWLSGEKDKGTFI